MNVEFREMLRVVFFLCLAAVVCGCVSNQRSIKPSVYVVIQPTSSDAESDGFDDFAEFGEFAEETVPEVYDPLEGYNRVMFRVNDTLYIWVLRPVCRGYAFVVPEPGRVAVKSFFKNLAFPIRFVNNMLQLKFKKSGVETLRFCINSTVGLAGFFDPATAWFKLEPCEEDFGQTLGHYGVGEGFPLVIPIFGFSNLRDSLSMIPDGFLYPVNYLNPSSHSIAVRSGDLVNEVSLFSAEYDAYKKDAVDPYIFFRNAYKQNRKKKVEK